MLPAAVSSALPSAVSSALPSALPSALSSALLASIPSPPDNALELGPLTLRFYGIAIALGVVAAVVIARRRWAGRGGDPDQVTAMAMWAVPAGLVGARLWHVLTDHHRFEGRWLHALAVWEGGLGIPGGIIAGVLTGIWFCRRRGIPVIEMLDVVAPALPVAQAVGRLGNWFNQELFGRPTSLPWGLEIDAERRPDGYETEPTFHPTFLYEALWNLALAGLIVLLGKRRLLRPGQAFGVYVAGYGLGRLWVESLRIDEATRLLGLRVNIWTALAFVAFGVVWFVLMARRPRPAAVGSPDPDDGRTSTELDGSDLPGGV